MADSMVLPFFDALPPGLRSALLVGAVGRSRLARLADSTAAMAATGRPELAAMALDMLLAAVAEDPLDARLATHTLGLGRSLGLPPGIEPALAALARAEPPESGRALYERIEAAGDRDRLLRFLEERVAAEPGGLEWRRRLYFHAQREADWGRVDVALAGAWPEELAAVCERLRADALFGRGEYEDSAQGYERSAASLAGLGLERAGIALARAGRRDEAIRLLRRAVRARPWRVNSLLTLHDLALEVDREARLPAGQVAILLYSWNKAALLDRTLAALRESTLGDSRLAALDNGSTDDTALVLARWRKRFGAERFEVVSLPVNVGAPAARNWLLGLETVRRSDWVAFLDDDALPPPDWLERLGAAASRYPEASVFGCKVAELGRPGVLQHADLHLAESSPADAVALSTLHQQDQDFGQFDYLRPCASVTGCCHLFPRERLLAGGGFELCFSPSQFDDLERDLRLGLAGEAVVYQGWLAAAHARSAGGAARIPGRAAANARGNMVKLRGMYPDASLERIRAQAQARVAADFEAKAATLAGLDLA